MRRILALVLTLSSLSCAQDVGDVDRTSTATTAEARVYVGRTFQATAVRVPGLRLDARNVLYARAVDQTDTTSAVARYPAANATARWHVKKPRSRTLVVNDYRRPSATTIRARWSTYSTNNSRRGSTRRGCAPRIRTGDRRWRRRLRG